jgi:hypothetical protein
MARSMTSDKTLETRLGEVLYNGQIEDIYFNETYTNIIYMMKKLVEDGSYKIELYEIGKENIDLYSEDSFENYFKKMNKMRERQFGLENTLKQILWDGQVPEKEFDKAFNEIIGMMKNISEDQNYAAQLYKINLDDYKDDEE